MFCPLVPISDCLSFVVISGMHGMALQRITCDSAINGKNYEHAQTQCFRHFQDLGKRMALLLGLYILCI